ncbi:MAG: hypothetical protein KF817_05610 [Phycisphaeraceae bacterium]|nr:hypothetical protein [Phycisphaeraceae bacterium]
MIARDGAPAHESIEGDGTPPVGVPPPSGSTGRDGRPGWRPPEFALPTARLVAVVWTSTAFAGAAWTLVMLMRGATGWDLATGALGALVVGLGATTGLLAIRPWRPRPLDRWPAVWMGASGVRLLVTLGIGLLLYSATPSGTVHLWFSVAIAYAATLVGETRAYAAAMRPYIPGRTADPHPADRAR